MLGRILLLFLILIPVHVEGTIFSNSIHECLEKSDTLITENKSFDKKLNKTENIFLRFIQSFNDIDTTYIEPNYYNYAAMLQNTNFYQSYRLRASEGRLGTQNIIFSPSPNVKVGPYFGWRWIFLGYTFDVSNPHSAGKSSEFNLSLYSSMIGVDLVYIKNAGNFNIKRISGFGSILDERIKNVVFNGANTYTASLNLYYVFNHRKFSYPAAFAQSTVQRKSCGSWMLGFRYDKQRIKFDYTALPSEMVNPNPETGAPGLLEKMKVNKLDYRNYSVCGGYAYNWVFAKNFLLSVSVAPSIGFKQAKGERLKGESFWVNVKNLNFDFISRFGLVWNNTKWFAGASFINHLYDYRRDRFSLTNSVNYFNVYVGLNFHKRKQYRK